MPSTNPVYQPTTVNYERHKEWTANNYLTERVIPNCHQKPYLQRLLLIGSVILAVIGLSLAIYALVSDSNAHRDDAFENFEKEPMPKFDDNSSEETANDYDPPASENSGKITDDFGSGDSVEPEPDHDHEKNIVLGSVGIILVLVSLGMYVGFLYLRGMFKGLLPLQSGAGLHQAGPSSHSNESGHQSSISYKGVQQEAGNLNLEPSVPMEEERHSLMDNKFQTRYHQQSRNETKQKLSVLATRFTNGTASR